MHRLTYISSRGQVLELDVPVSTVGTGTSLRGFKPSSTLGSRMTSGIAMNAQEVTLDLYVSGTPLAEQMFHTFEFDFMRQTPGELVLDNEWRQSAYVAKSEVQSVYHDHADVALTVLLLDGLWHKVHTKSFEVEQAVSNAEWLNLPTNAPYNLGETRRPSTFEVDTLLECPMKMTIYGPAVRPRIMIGKNTYAFNVTIPLGARLVVDGTRVDKTIVLITQDEDATDSFDVGQRGGGKGQGTYCFEPLSGGVHTVSWDGSYGFDIEWWECRGGLPWTS